MIIFDDPVFPQTCRGCVLEKLDFAEFSQKMNGGLRQDSGDTTDLHSAT